MAGLFDPQAQQPVNLPRNLLDQLNQPQQVADAEFAQQLGSNISSLAQQTSPSAQANDPNAEIRARQKKISDNIKRSKKKPKLRGKK